MIEPSASSQCRRDSSKQCHTICPLFATLFIHWRNSNRSRCCSKSTMKFSKKYSEAFMRRLISRKSCNHCNTRRPGRPWTRRWKNNCLWPEKSFFFWGKERRGGGQIAERKVFSTSRKNRTEWGKEECFSFPPVTKGAVCCNYTKLGWGHSLGGLLRRPATAAGRNSTNIKISRIQYVEIRPNFNHP